MKLTPERAEELARENERRKARADRGDVPAFVIEEYADTATALRLAALALRWHEADKAWRKPDAKHGLGQVERDALAALRSFCEEVSRG